MRIAICDDEREQRAYLKTTALAWARQNNITPVFYEYSSAAAFLLDWRQYAFDIVLLDIQLDAPRQANTTGLDGISLARLIRQTDERLVIIFITGYDDYMPLGYEVSALHYLIKPVSEVKLREVLDKAAVLLTRQPRMLLLDAVDGTARVNAEDIVYAEMFSHYAEIHCLAYILKVKIKMQDLNTLLGAGFFRCHRSYIVNMAYVEKITRTDILLDKGQSLPLSRKLYGEAYRAFNAYYFKLSGIKESREC